ncbi:hypothetical protein WMF26_11525 [Sorangium sp. So ce185]|uniref:hypothetical protein n=1 Tax=Sorangium sp. So ce185 TaxID=3133287 RepID=UPI003F629343
MRKARAAVAAVLVAAGVALSAGPLRAEPTGAEQEIARVRMAEGRARFAKSDFQGALTAFTEADEIMKVPTTGIARALTQQRLKRLLDARDIALRVMRYPVSPSEPPEFTKARVEAAKLSEELLARIPAIEITVEGPPSGAAVVVKLDGSVLPRSAAGLRRMVDPGRHTITVAAPGYMTERLTVMAAQGDVVPVEVVLRSAPLAAPDVRRPELQARSTPRWPGWVGAGGALASAAAAVFAADFGIAQRAVDRRCPTYEGGGYDCPSLTAAQARDLEARRNRDLVLAISFGGVGAGALVAAAVGYLSAPSSRERARPTPTVTGWVASSGGGGVIQGSF